MMDLAESFHSENYAEAVEMFFERGWTDGLPVVLPTRELVEAMIAASGRDRHESLGVIQPREGNATVEYLAINAVMGGCKPAHFPVVLAAFEAMMAPQHNITGVVQTTHMCSPLAVVNGPIARELNFNSRDGVFGNGYRANAVVGRAVRLALWNLGGAVPWGTDMSVFSNPSEYTFCIAEEEEENPWEPWHVERGCAPGSNAVTVFACEGPHSCFTLGSIGEMLTGLCDTMAAVGNNNVHASGQTMVVLNPRVANEFAAAGWSKNDVRAHLWENGRRSVAKIRSLGATHAGFRETQHVAGRILNRYNPRHLGPEAMIPVTDRPEDIHIIVAGGKSYFSAILPGWGSFGGYAATALIRRP
jgi:hypothetical protein